MKIKKSKRVLFSIITIISIISFSLISIELFLMTVNPFKLRLNPMKYYDSIKNSNSTYIINNINISSDKADELISISRNSIGLRGPEPTRKDDYKIIAMGGSTTECIILSDNTTWVDLLAEKLKKNNSTIWMNNAGVNGQSTFGHIDYLENYVLSLKPDMILFLIGANEQNQYYLNNENTSQIDYGIDRLNNYNKNIPEKKHVKKSNAIFDFVEKNKSYSQILMTLSEFRRRKLSRNLSTGYRHNLDLSSLQKLSHEGKESEVDLKRLKTKKISNSRVEKELIKQRDHQEDIEDNILKLISITKKYNIEPIFITQPALFGNSIDPDTGVHLGEMILQEGNVGWGQGLTGHEMWVMLESYNEITRKVAKKNNLHLIDLANELPKRSKYFYDFVHFSKPGAVTVSKIIYKHLCEIIKKKNMFNSFKQCRY